VTFTVVWEKAAEARLASLWIASPSERNTITARVAGLEAALRCDPLNVGESRGGNRRMVIDHPIAMRFTVSEPDRLVRVTAFWHI
jgi:hypothetical protein